MFQDMVLGGTKAGKQKSFQVRLLSPKNDRFLEHIFSAKQRPNKTHIQHEVYLRPIVCSTIKRDNTDDSCPTPDL
jgi:hypothetical protein